MIIKFHDNTIIDLTPDLKTNEQGVIENFTKQRDSILRRKYPLYWAIFKKNRKIFEHRWDNAMRKLR